MVSPEPALTAHCPGCGQQEIVHTRDEYATLEAQHATSCAAELDIIDGDRLDVMNLPPY